MNEGTTHRELLKRRWKGDKRQIQRVSDGHSAQGHMRKPVAKGARDVGRPWGKNKMYGGGGVLSSY